MPQVALYLLGPPHLERGGETLHIARTKAVALLAYLAVEDRRHSRDTLAALLWPELDHSHARGYLRRTLSELNRALGEGLITADRKTIGLCPDADSSENSGQVLRVDVAAFRQHLAASESHEHSERQPCPECLAALTGAVALYRDDFMAGFTLPDSLEFDEWQRFQTEGLRDELGSALQRLVLSHSAQTEYEPAIAYARRWLELDKLHEPAHRQLMALYARAGRHAAALRQYRECIRALEGELGVPPSAETTALYEQLRAKREIVAPVPTAAPTIAVTHPPRPAFLSDSAEPVVVERPVFVARERQLARLKGYLDRALAGQGGVVFVTGGPGRGKTALMDEFARRAMEAHRDLLVAVGNCNAYSGMGDPYSPFRGAMAMLTGDVESRWVAGAISREHARRMWKAAPLAVQAVAEHGTDCINIFVSGPALLSRADAFSPDSPDWLGRLKERVEGQKQEPGDLAQSQLFDGYTDVLRVLATQRPLLLLLDDLQWADNASISLLFHLGRELADGGSRILIVGAYRPAEVALGRPGIGSAVRGERERHPLEKVLTEFKRRYGDVWLDLARAEEAEGRRFIEAFLETEPNRLDETFRQALFQHTGGHPLFTVELLREMQERGDLVRDADGAWVVGPALDWVALPARVEGVIEERIGRLEEELRDVLAVASVEGEDFTAQVVARVGEIGERQLVRVLSQELEKRHRLVRETEALQVSRQRLSRYRFAHSLFQSYLYNGLSAGERALLHGEIAQVLEALYARAGRTDDILPQLAHHYAEAGVAEKAIDYLLRAGDQAYLAYAHAEAVDHYQRALVFLEDGAEYHRAARTLMKLGLTHHSAYHFRRARQAYAEGFALWQQATEAGQAEPLRPAPHPLRLVWPDPMTLDPARIASHYSDCFFRGLFAGLGRHTSEMGLVPDVARSWEVSADGCRYTFHLRDDAQWSDGTPVTARDFEYAWKRILDPATRSPYGQDLLDVKGARDFHQGKAGSEALGVSAVDDLTLVVEVEAPTSYFLETAATTPPVPRHVVEALGKAWADGKHIVTN
ncbi:MAG: AAA family ATPase, partial [Anaerolineae bacterium]